ncbi:hypothetical protein AXX16_1628 [Serratia rubidaea]|nr:hypothetical protein AXX16_1628 [Serratia rubidaea]
MLWDEGLHTPSVPLIVIFTLYGGYCGVYHRRYGAKQPDPET